MLLFFLTVAYRFLRRQVRWSGIPISLRIFHSLLWPTQSKCSQWSRVDVFLEFSCFFDDPEDDGNLISGSSAFSKSCLYLWKPSVHVLLKPGLKDFEHYPPSVWNKRIYMIEHSLSSPFFGTGMKTDLFCHGLCRLGPADSSQWEEGCRGPKSRVKQGCFICRSACLYNFIQGSFRQ